MDPINHPPDIALPPVGRWHEQLQQSMPETLHTQLQKVRGSMSMLSNTLLLCKRALLQSSPYFLFVVISTSPFGTIYSRFPFVGLVLTGDMFGGAI